MSVPVTYEDYLTFGYSAAQGAFESRLAAAQAEVDFLVGINAVTDEIAYKKAVCTAADALERAEAGGGSLSIGGFSASGLPLYEGTAHQAAQAAAAKVLATTGMTYAGVA